MWRLRSSTSSLSARRDAIRKKTFKVKSSSSPKKTVASNAQRQLHRILHGRPHRTQAMTEDRTMYMVRGHGLEAIKVALAGLDEETTTSAEVSNDNLEASVVNAWCHLDAAAAVAPKFSGI